jgi:thiol-disulfide isomerase/thioredoxin
MRHILLLFMLALLIVSTSCKVIIPKIVVHRFGKHYGKQVADFKVYDLQDSIVSFRQKFEGKVMYLSIGEISCGATIQYYENVLPKLMFKYQKFDSLLFVNILIDNDINRWEEFIQNNNPPGINLRYSGNKLNIFKIFDFDFFPFECVINKDFTFAGHDLCGFGSEAAPYFALHDRNVIKGMKETMKLFKYDAISIKYTDETFKSNLNEDYAYDNFYFKEFYGNASLNTDSSIIITDIIDDLNAVDIIDTIIEKHKGKTIYVDFWAPWCAPCRDEMNYSHELYNRLDSSKVSFVYVCIDTNYEQFLNYINTNQIKGSHFYLDREQSKLLRNEFNIKGIPYYMLIDRYGKIIFKGNDIRPSKQETENKIRLLKTGA